MADRLEYRPVIQYTTKDHEGKWDIISRFDEYASKYPSSVDIWKKIKDAREDVYSAIESINQGMRNYHTDIDIDEDLLREAKETYSDTSPPGKMSFELYKILSIILKTTNIARYKNLVDEYEQRHRELDGKIEIDLYHIATDLEDELYGMSQFVKDTLFNMSHSEVHAGVNDESLSDDILSEIYNIEQNRLDQINSMLRQYDNTLKEEDIETKESEELMDNIRYYSDKEKVVIELKSLIDSKLNMIHSEVNNIKDSIGLDEERLLLGHKDLIGRHLRDNHRLDSSGALTDYKMLFITNCHKKSIQCKRHIEQLHSSVSISQRKNLEASLTSMAHYRRKIVCEAADWIVKTGRQELEAIDPKVDRGHESIDIISNVIADAIAYVDEDYYKYLRGYDRITRLGNSIRNKYLSLVIDREQVRELNKARESLLEEG